MNMTMPSPKLPGCAVPRTGGWPPGTSTGACQSPAKRPTQRVPIHCRRFARERLANPKGTALLVLDNFHRFLNSAEVMQALVRQIASGKQNRTFLLVLSPVVQIPVELEKLFVVLEHELPDRDQLEAIARGTATEPDDLPEAAYLCG